MKKKNKIIHCQFLSNEIGRWDDGFVFLLRFFSAFFFVFLVNYIEAFRFSISFQSYMIFITVWKFFVLISLIRDLDFRVCAYWNIDL